MKRFLAALVGLAIVACATLEVLGQTQQGRKLNSYNVTCAASTPTNVVSHNSARVSLVILNVGTTHAAVGQSVSARPFTLHAGTALTLNNYVGSMDCLSSGSVQIQVLEEER
jgi:hypothetical protein